MLTLSSNIVFSQRKCALLNNIDENKTTSLRHSLIFYLQNSSFTTILWGNGRTSEEPDDYIPPDTPTCGFYNELCVEPTETSSYDNNIYNIRAP